ncbi:Nitrogen permease regulator 3 [Cladobotryum mycophilum]|uniref:Nitrogen permease regulator 3 n=1 Tax=Cladobotryum mycophilum TaxID=491253 RepID=A0ABR0S747_9HYPO
MSYVNNENFLAVALVINRSRDGPAFVFHYPSHVQSVSDAPEKAGTVELEDILFERLSQPASNEISRTELVDKLGSHDDHHMTEAGSQIVPWEHVAGFPARDLAGILTPARSYHKKLFQLSLDPLLCVSYPIHVPENGKWRKPKKANKARAARLADESIAPHESEPSPTTQQPEPCKDKGVDKDKDNDKEKQKEEVDEEKRSSMTMFNLVFILHPKKNEVKELVDSLYTNIVKKVNKAYQYSQQHSEFVWKESKRILLAKDRAREEQKNMGLLWRELLQTSSLAASVHDIYEAVSQNKIATLHLDTIDGILTPSVQIPAPFFISDIPPEDDERHRGLWLTTSNAFLSQDALEEPGFLDRNFALLLMDDEKKIVSELQSDRDPATLSMVEFVRLAKPTMSFYQVGQSHVLTLSQVRKYAQHFIFWRRAIAIPPLHPRDMYIVSPNCDLERLPQASQQWQRAFPLAPPLPNFLAELSVCPRPYKHISPSKTHRPLYLRMLAWLMRGGWVMQLCTFAYVVIWPEILYEVDYEIEAEELGAAASASTGTEDTHNTEDSEDAQAGGSSPMAQQQQQQQPPLVPNPSTLSAAEHSAEMARLERIALKAHREAADKATAHARKTIPIATSHPSINDARHLAGISPHIILDPKKATGKESRYLSATANRFKDEKVRNAWQLMCKYFDGRCALERIALQEDMKRKETWTLLTGMREYLICTRHW